MSKTVPEAAFGCVGSTIRLRSGGYFDLLNPDPDVFTLHDIAGALSKICRFGGQIPRWYSVAEHSLWCAYVAEQDGHPRDVQRAALLHDAAEAFIGDIVKPLKVVLDRNSQLSDIEREIDVAITLKWGVAFERHRVIIKEIDKSMLFAERNAIFGRDGMRWTGEESAQPIVIMPHFYTPEQAETAFIECACRLGIGEDE